MPETTPSTTDTRPTRFYLIRHGQAVVNVKPIMGGMKGDVGLTELGVRQAECLRDRLLQSGEIRADVVIASTLPRARQTAEIIAPALNLAPIFDDEVQEFRVGDEGDGLTLDEYKKRFGWVDLEAEPTRPVDPGGDSWLTFYKRVSGALTRIEESHRGKNVVIVCHGGVVDSSFVHFFGMNPEQVPPAGFATENTSITLWERVVHRGRLRWRLGYYNDYSHLHGLERIATVDFTDQSDHPSAPAAPTEDATAESGG